MKLSDKLKLLRMSRGETQEEVSKKIGMGITTLRNYENNKLDRIPTTVQLKQLKNYYNVSYEYLLEEDCENTTIENINIGKVLKLTDNSISAIKDLGDNSSYFNIALESFDLKDFIEAFKKYYQISSILKEDLFGLIYIADLSEYIEDRIKKGKEDDLREYFNQCSLSVSRIMKFIYSKDNLFFSPSDSAYDLLKENYTVLYNTIFEEKQNSEEKIKEFYFALEEFIDLYQEVLVKINLFQRTSSTLLNEKIDSFLQKYSLKSIDTDNHKKKIMGEYYKYSNIFKANKKKEYNNKNI